MSVSLNSASFTSVWMISLRMKKRNKTPAAFSWNQLNLGAKIPVCQEISWWLRKAIDTAAELKRREGKTYFIFPSSYWKIALTTKSYLFHRDAIVCCNQTDPFLICPIRRRTANNPPKNPVQIGKERAILYNIPSSEENWLNSLSSWEEREGKKKLKAITCHHWNVSNIYITDEFHII